MPEQSSFEAALRIALASFADSQHAPPGMAQRLTASALAGQEGNRPRTPVRWRVPAAVSIIALVIASGAAFIVNDARSHGGGIDTITEPLPPSTGGILADVPVSPPVATSNALGTCTFAGANYGSPSHSGPLVTVDPDPVVVTAVWIPGLNAHPCVAQLTHGDTVLAVALANDIRDATPWPPETYVCPADDGSRVLLYFTYHDQPQAQVATYNLTGCTGLSASGRSAREPGRTIQTLQPIMPAAFRQYIR